MKYPASIGLHVEMTTLVYSFISYIYIIKTRQKYECSLQKKQKWVKRVNYSQFGLIVMLGTLSPYLFNKLVVGLTPPPAPDLLIGLTNDHRMSRAGGCRD